MLQVCNISIDGGGGDKQERLCLQHRRDRDLELKTRMSKKRFDLAEQEKYKTFETAGFHGQLFSTRLRTP
jgi:hypothetical protein